MGATNSQNYAKVPWINRTYTVISISDSEEKDTLVPLQLAEDRVYIKIKINVPDTAIKFI